MHPEAVEGLPEKRVLAESRLAAKALAPVSAGKQARRQGHRVADGEGGIVRGEREELLPEALLYLPEVCCLPAEGGAMHSPQVREVVGVVAPEVGKELCIFFYPQEFTDNLTTSMVRTSESQSVGAGPLSRRRPRSLMRSSMRQKSETMKVLRSTRAETSFLLW